ncbi:MAG: carboxypeptidase regulatory-like domain-containing protein [candidate division Zixibacteria bacterium]|nr:carboxypeptidase regulatory-like domain-containing protein [candidate division Zixibacteria bacterium]
MNLSIGLSVVILLVLGACANPSISPTATGRMQGRVATRGQDVRVEARLDDVSSRVVAVGTDGRYTLYDLTPGAYRVYASAPGYQRSAVSGIVTVQAGATTTAPDIVLTWTGEGVASAMLTGTVRDAATGHPVEGVYLVVACDPSEIVCLGRSAFTNTEGKYVIVSIPPGYRFDLIVGKTGYSNRSVRGNVLGVDGTIPLDLALFR